MKIIITEDQYKTLVTNLLDTLMGKIRIKTVEEKKEDGIKEDWHTVFDEDGYQVMSIWVKGSLRSKGCKKDLTLDNSLNEKFEKYMPYYRHKIFSEVLVDYIYDKLGIKCDCVQYDYNFKEEKHYDEDGDEYEHTSSKTRRYNVKKKKKIKESVEDFNVVEQIMDVEGVKYDGCGYGGRTYDNFGRKHDTVEVYFKLPGEEKLYYRRIHFLTRNNKVVSVDSTGDFRTITDGFRYIPTDILMGYFIEKAKIYIEKLLRTLYPNDSLKESVIKESVMDDLIDSIFPQLNKLKTKSNFSSTIYGANTIYYNPEDKEYYFRVSEPRKVYVWGVEDTVETKYTDKTLFIDGKTYDEISNYVPDEKMIISWFNEKYNQDVKSLRRRSPLKGR